MKNYYFSEARLRAMVEQNGFSEEQVRAKNVLVARYLGKPGGKNVVGVGIGNKFTDGVDTGLPCVRVYVSKKIDDPRAISESALIPPDILGVTTDVIEIDHRLSPNPGVRRGGPTNLQKAAGGNGAGPGSSIGPIVSVPNVSPIVAGTLGAVLYDEQKPQNRYILSCNHVLSVDGRLPLDTTGIITPGPDENPKPKPKPIAKLSAVVRLNSDGPNDVDCAVAEIVPEVEVSDALPDLPPVKEYQGPRERMPVVKFGRATGKTTGRIVDVAADILVDYNFGTFRFINQVLIEGDDGDFAADGDSGAVVFCSSPEDPAPVPVAMVFAPAGKLTAACPMGKVISQLERELNKKLTFINKGQAGTDPDAELKKKTDPDKIILTSAKKEDQAGVADQDRQEVLSGL